MTSYANNGSKSPSFPSLQRETHLENPSFSFMMVMAHTTHLMLSQYLENTMFCSSASHLILHISSSLLMLVFLVHFNVHGLIDVTSLLMTQVRICPVRMLLNTTWMSDSRPSRSQQSLVHLGRVVAGLSTQTSSRMRTMPQA